MRDTVPCFRCSLCSYDTWPAHCSVCPQWGGAQSFCCGTRRVHARRWSCMGHRRDPLALGDQRLLQKLTLLPLVSLPAEWGLRLGCALLLGNSATEKQWAKRSVPVDSRRRGRGQPPGVQCAGGGWGLCSEHRGCMEPGLCLPPLPACPFCLAALSVVPIPAKALDPCPHPGPTAGGSLSHHQYEPGFGDKPHPLGTGPGNPCLMQRPVWP